MKKRHWLMIALVSLTMVVTATKGVAIIEGDGNYETTYQSIAEDLGNDTFVVEGRCVRALIKNPKEFYYLVTTESQAGEAHKAMRSALRSLFEKHPDLEVWRITPLVQHHGYTLCILVETAKKKK